MEHRPSIYCKDIIDDVFERLKPIAITEGVLGNGDVDRVSSNSRQTKRVDFP